MFRRILKLNRVEVTGCKILNIIKTFIIFTLPSNIVMGINKG
jgi:hypothetical protein